MKNRWRMVSKLTQYKVQNAYQIYRSFKASRKKGLSLMRGLPYSVSIEPTTACNLRCPECPSGLRNFTRPTGNLNRNFFNDFIQANHKHLIYLNFYFQGEPFIHKEFLDMVKIASQNQVFTSTSTNAHFINDSVSEKIVESGLDRLIISIDGADQATYEQYRKEGKLEKVIAGTEAIVKAKRSFAQGPEIIFQFLVVRPNEHQIEEIKALGKKLGVDNVVLKTAQIYDFENGHPLIPENEQYSRYSKDRRGKYRIKNPLDDQCWKMWHSCVITWDGKVVPCCFDKDAKYSMGDLKEESLASIWSSPKYNSFRNAILQSRSEIDICKNCSEGTKVWAD
ncbi:MAG: radical SAM protein [Flavobacteriales bacterium]|nr:radical SAM protein [Flavobacteriales bacterium]